MNEPTASTRADVVWLTVPQATAHLGISEKTLRRRIKSGALESQKNPKTDGGGTVLLVRVDGVPVTGSGETVNAPDILQRAPDSVPVTFKSEPDSVPVNDLGAPDNSGSVTGARAGHEMDSVPVTSDSDVRVLAAESQALRDREEIMFLRTLIEQRDRDAAELRASLREALRAMPKAIEAREYSQPESVAENGLEVPKSGAAVKVSGAQRTGGKRAPRSLWRLILGLR